MTTERERLRCDECGVREPSPPEALEEVAREALGLPPPVIDALILCDRCEEPIYHCPKHWGVLRDQCRRCRG